jgi:GH3 auxin-responsive promoter
MFKDLLRRLAAKVVAVGLRRQLRAFERATERPLETQAALLRRILARNADTEFGRDHAFSKIHSTTDFRRLPIANYEYYEPYIERVRRGELQALLGERAVHMFALTSGTTAARKFIPVTPQYLADYKRGWHIWGLKVFRDHPQVKMRPIVQMSGDWDELRTEADQPCGSVTGLTAKMQKRMIRSLYCVPACVAKVKDSAAKYYLALRLSAHRSVGMVIAANPSTMINMARAGDLEKESLIRDLHDGTLNPRFAIPTEVRTALAGRLDKKQPEKARQLEQIVARTGTLYPKDYWPPYCLLGNWTGGSMGAYLRHYPKYFGSMPVRDVGLIASEGRMTIPFADNTPSGVLDITTHYFEFIPENEIDSKQPTVLGAHELEQGQAYYILPTTAFGLYRYHISDLVRVTGFFNKTPLIEFLSKGSHFANVTGEKLSEYHVAHAMADVLARLDLSINTYSMAPCWDDLIPFYGLFVEKGEFNEMDQGMRLARALDERLGVLNIEYAAKRESKRLGSVRLQLLPGGAWAKWDRQRLAERGGTLEQYKHPCLIPDAAFPDAIKRISEPMRVE